MPTLSPAAEKLFCLCMQVDWAPSVLDTLDAPAFYRGMSRMGIRYGPRFRMLLKKATDNQAAVLRCTCQGNICLWGWRSPQIYAFSVLFCSPGPA